MQWVVDDPPKAAALCGSERGELPKMGVLVLTILLCAGE
jgi:hypothetical protein